MFGPVSLSASYPQYAKELIIDFYGNYFKGQRKIVKSKNPFEYETVDIALDQAFGFTDYKEDFKILKNKLKSMDCVVPTLFKQYSELCDDGGVKFYDFNIDSQFSDCVDGFIMVDIQKIKQNKKDRYIK